MLIKMIVTTFENDSHNVKLHPQKMLVAIIVTFTNKMLDIMLLTIDNVSHIIQKIGQRIDVVRHKCKSLTQIITDQSEALELRGA